MTYFQVQRITAEHTIDDGKRVASGHTHEQERRF